MIVKKGSLSDVLLLALEKAAEGALLLEDFTYEGQMRSWNGINIKKDMSLVMAVRRLRENGMIERKKNQDNKTVLRLTNMGNEFVVGRSGNNWDGKYRLVIWDIPENKRVIRNLFRRKLKDFGFVLLQKSVWVSKRNVTSQLKGYIEELGLGNWVSVIESEDPTLARLFI
jgi:DNA-binding transcriptional regulator PaaX